jgi:hypothetical protein
MWNVRPPSSSTATGPLSYQPNSSVTPSSRSAMKPSSDIDRVEITAATGREA